MSLFSRRSFLSSLPIAAASTSVPALFVAAPRTARAQSTPLNLLADAEQLLASLESAFSFMNGIMDAYAQGSTLRLIQSYSDGGLNTTGFTYDNAVAIHAYLSRGTADDLERAVILGESLLYAQAHNFPFADGRFAQAYYTGTPDSNGAYITPAADPFYFYGSAVGDQAWAGMALAQLYNATKRPEFLSGALLVANWIVTNTYNTLGPGGYSFGTVINSSNQSEPSTNGKSTEHNIDTYAFFTMLAKLTGGGTANNGMTWSDLALHAAAFCAALYNANGPYFWTGTEGDQITTNYSPIPEDCQTWSYLAGLNEQTRGTIDWALANLQATDTANAPHTSLTGSQQFTGMVFDSASLSTTADDPDAVWLEGTAHTISALVARVLHGGDSLPAILSDLNQAARLLGTCVEAQAQLGAGQTYNGKTIPGGLQAATSILDTGFGYTYGPTLHLGATGWYLIAGFAANPFQLGYRVLG